MKRLVSHLSTFLSSRAFFYGILGFFIFEVLWMVFSAVYPMAFDEDFHLGIIRIYADHWLPFLHQQPAGADVFGAVARDPSYLYHYLMSFPYRLIEAITPSQTAQVIFLRLINVALIAYSLTLFRKVLLRATKSAGLTNISLAIFVLVPIVPQLAAHINYDNLIMVLMGWACLLAYRIIDEFNAKQINARTLLLLINLCMLACLVKYAFLPIAMAIAAFVVYYGFRSLRGVAIWPKLIASIRQWKRPMLVGLVLLTMVSGGLFVQRFGVNAIKYGDPIADCGDVLSYDHCKAYGPWIRNHDFALTKGHVNPNPLAYTYTWIKALWFRLFFAVNGANSNFTNYPPLPIPYVAAAIIVSAGVILVLRYARRIFCNDPFAVFSLLVIVTYCAALWYEEYGQYLDTGQPVAINGRYLIPVLLLVAILLGKGFQNALDRSHDTQVVLAALALLCFMHGGGLATFILRSDASWDWQNHTVIEINDTARSILAPITIEGSKYY
jgi:hypothetical protein